MIEKIQSFYWVLINLEKKNSSNKKVEFTEIMREKMLFFNSVDKDKTFSL